MPSIAWPDPKSISHCLDYNQDISKLLRPNLIIIILPLLLNPLLHSRGGGVNDVTAPLWLASVHSAHKLSSIWKFVFRCVWGLLSRPSLILHDIPTLWGVAGSLLHLVSWHKNCCLLNDIPLSKVEFFYLFTLLKFWSNMSLINLSPLQLASANRSQYWRLRHHPQHILQTYFGPKVRQ